MFSDSALRSGLDSALLGGFVFDGAAQEMEKVEGEVEVDEARSTRPRRRHHAVDHTTSEADVNSKSSNNPQQSENEFGQKTAIGDAQSNFAATLSTFGALPRLSLFLILMTHLLISVEKASQPDYQFDSFSGLYFDNKNDVFYDPQTAVYFNPENGSLHHPLLFLSGARLSPSCIKLYLFFYLLICVMTIIGMETSDKLMMR